MNRKGFSLMELAITVGLMAVMAGVVAAGGGMMDKCRLQREIEAVRNLQVAGQNYLSMKNLNYAGVSIEALKTEGLLPASFDPVKANSFGGDYAVGANSDDNTRIDIALTNVPERAGSELAEGFRSSSESVTYDKDGKIWTVTF
jgi:prepilin-type N-terminal cleavage/methylation domain-containing protein